MIIKRSMEFSKNNNTCGPRSTRSQRGKLLKRSAFFLRFRKEKVLCAHAYTKFVRRPKPLICASRSDRPSGPLQVAWRSRHDPPPQRGSLARTMALAVRSRQGRDTYINTGAAGIGSVSRGALSREDPQGHLPSALHCLLLDVIPPILLLLHALDRR
jgi:hypothetical protein